tara:strand:+ start:1233 stop:1517 length:285 start_codon:yes stop_codon:yes gene_type:complete
MREAPEDNIKVVVNKDKQGRYSFSIHIKRLKPDFDLEKGTVVFGQYNGATGQIQEGVPVKMFLKLYGQSSLKERFNRLKNAVEEAEKKGKPVLI